MGRRTSQLEKLKKKWLEVISPDFWWEWQSKVWANDSWSSTRRSPPTPNKSTRKKRVLLRATVLPHFSCRCLCLTFKIFKRRNFSDDGVYDSFEYCRPWVPRFYLWAMLGYLFLWLLIALHAPGCKTNLWGKVANWKPGIEFTSWDIGSREWCQVFGNELSCSVT